MATNFNTEESAPLSRHVMDFDHRIHWNIKILKSGLHACRRYIAESSINKKPCTLNGIFHNDGANFSVCSAINNASCTL